MNKAKLLFVAIAAIIVTMFSQGTYAYYTTIGRATNVVTSGNIQFKIHEKTDSGSDFPADGVYIVPGDIVSKKVYFENTCNHPFYLRVKLIKGIEGSELSAEELLKLDIDEQNWTFVDGYYYYNTVVEPGSTTPVLFSKVEIVGDKVDNSYLGKILQLTVDASATQSENNPALHPWTSLGWPVD